MAFVGTNPLIGTVTGTASSWDFTPSTNQTGGLPWYVFIGNRKSGTGDVPTLSGTNGLNVTWTQVTTVVSTGGNPNRLTFFRGIPSSTSTGTLSVTTTAAQAQLHICAVEGSGVDTTTNQGVVQTVADSTSGTAVALTLAAFASTGNATLMGTAADSSPSAYAGEAGYTVYTSLSGSSRLATQWVATSADTNPTGTWTGSALWWAIAAEIAVTTTAAGAARRHFRTLVGVGI